MPRDGSVMSEAYRRFQADKARRQGRLEQRRAEIYRQVPAVEAIDRELRSTAARIVLAAFESEGDPEEALRALEKSNLELQAERAERLKQAGFEGEALDDAPACAICGDAGYLPDGEPCRCLLAYYTREQNRRLSKLMDLENQSFERFPLDWYSQQVSQKYAGTFSRSSKNMLFTGAPGLGKTFLSACIARVVSERGFSVVYDTAAHILQQFEMRKFGREDPYEEDPDRDVNRYLNCDLLIMDDLGTEMELPFAKAVVYQIINDRLVNGRKTVLSTNLTVEEIGRRYGEAVLSRVRGEYQIIRFFGEDIRRMKSSV